MISRWGELAKGGYLAERGSGFTNTRPESRCKPGSRSTSTESAASAAAANVSQVERQTTGRDDKR